MRCPFCQQDDDRVLDSRSSTDAYSIRRRRECLNCQRRYTTYERLEELSIRVIKKDGVREPFSRDKIRQGVVKACWKRPVSTEDIESLISEIESQIYTQCNNEISASKIGEIVMAALGDLDQVAFVRFASVYREFKDVRDFVDELQPILQRTSR
ncbi:MAG: transcriptional regulator NrdR [Planctomycetota bacterium]|nr:transcriptional regulator NrdR [Planctomycetota bacterium]